MSNTEITNEIYSPKEKQIKNYGNKELSVTINNKAIIPILADKIYKNPMSAIRELYNNEITQCERVKKLFPNELTEIKITYDSNTRELNITGINSMGIDDKTFNEGLRVMGNSGNNDESMKGLWGLGFYSFVKISERIIIVTKSRLENKDKSWICKSALSFEELQPDQYEKLDTYGTRLTLVLKDSVNETDLIDTIEKICKLSGIKTVFIYDNEIQDLTQFFKLEDYFKEKFHNFFFDKYCSYSINYTHVNNSDYEAFIFKVGGKNSSELNEVYESYLLNTPIDLKFKHSTYSEGYDGVIVNIKNERKFEPKPDREQFEQASEDEINEDLKLQAQKIPHVLREDKKIKTLSQWYDNKMRHFITTITNDKIDMDQNVKSLSYENYRSANTYYYMNRFLPITKPDVLLVSKTFRKAGFANVKEHLESNNKSVFCVAVKNTDKDYTDLIKLGFKDFSLYIREHKIKVNVKAGSSKTKKFVFHGRYNNFYDQLPQTNAIVFKVKNINDHITTIRTIQNDGVYFITDNAQYKNAKVIDDIPKILGFNTVYITNLGLMTFKQIVTRAKQLSSTQVRFTKEKFNHIGFNASDPEDEKGLTIAIKSDKTQDLFAIYLREKAQRSFYSCYDTFSYYNYLKKRIKSKLLQKILSDLVDKSDINEENVKVFWELDKLK